MPFGNSDWNKAYAADPIDAGAAGSDVVDFFIDEQDSNNVYIAYYGEANTDPTRTAGITSGKLFYSFNATSPTPSWDNRTPYQVKDDRINSIAVDPKNIGRIWVALGNIDTNYVGASPDTMKNRVMYSNDTGLSWTDVSKGLSALPVNKLLYRKGSIDEIYAGTDVGVFKWNNTTNEWECFNNSLPTCIVMDMEINYCANKLRVATYGRRIWETVLGEITLQPTATITAGTPPWTGGHHHYLNCSIDIPAGVTLTISGDTVHMPRGGIIAVEPGGHLIVDHALITNSCNSCLWQGIQARGQVLMSQDPSPYHNQGFVSIQNNSIIEHVIIGVANSNTDTIWSTNGGVIQCDASTFLNCQTSVDFQGYDNWYSGGLSPNRSYFYNCNFLLDNNYKGNTIGLPMQNMVHMHGVEGIVYAGCIFRNTDKATINKGMGAGIRATNSAFNVWPYCASLLGCPYPVRSQFSGFTNAIDIRGLWQPGLAVNIDQADFDTTTTGVYINAFNNVSTTRCNFNIGRGKPVDSIVSDTHPVCSQNFGIFIQNTSIFRIEENNFTKVPNYDVDYYGSPWYNYGTVVANSGGKMNKVYRNNFNSLDYAVYAIGNNMVTPDSSFTDGLKILCNAFSNDGTDILVTSDGGSLYQGINGQGSIFASAGNTFSGSSRNIVNYVSNPVYYYYTIGHTPTENPAYIYAVPYVMTTLVSSPKSCPSSYSTGTFAACIAGSTTALTMSSLQTHKQNFRVNQSILQSLQGAYRSQLDFGNTDSLVVVIDTSTYSPSLYSMLSGGAPYISTTALKAVADINVLGYSEMMNVMRQNPDDLHDYDFLNYVNNDYHFSADDMDTLRYASLNTTARTTLEQTMGVKRMTMADEANIIMMALTSSVDTNVTESDINAGICMDSASVYYRMDSTAFYFGLDSMDTWLRNIGGLWTKYERAAYYDFRGQHEIADSIFNGILGMLPAGDSTDSVTYVDYKKMRDVITGAEADGRNVYTLNDGEIDSLSPFGSTDITYNTAAVEIGTITDLRVTPYVPCVLVHFETYRLGHGGTTTKTIRPITDINSSKYNRFSVFPNPASGVVTFSYNVQDGGNDMRIVVTNVVGEKVATMQPKGSAGNAYWNPGNVAAGVYIYTASNDRGVISKGKVVVVK